MFYELNQIDDNERLYHLTHTYIPIMAQAMQMGKLEEFEEYNDVAYQLILTLDKEKVRQALESKLIEIANFEASDSYKIMKDDQPSPENQRKITMQLLNILDTIEGRICQICGKTKKKNKKKGGRKKKWWSYFSSGHKEEDFIMKKDLGEPDSTYSQEAVNVRPRARSKRILKKLQEAETSSDEEEETNNQEEETKTFNELYEGLPIPEINEKDAFFKLT